MRRIVPQASTKSREGPTRLIGSPEARVGILAEGLLAIEEAPHRHVLPPLAFITAMASAGKSRVRRAVERNLSEARLFKRF